MKGRGREEEGGKGNERECERRHGKNVRGQGRGEGMLRSVKEGVREGV